MNTKLFRDYVRGTAALIVLIILPFFQVFSTRIAPLVLTVAGLFCVAAILLSGKPKELLFSRKSLHKIDTVIFAFVVVSFVWAAISMSWALDPMRGLVRIVSIAVVLWISWLLAAQLKKLPVVRIEIVFCLGVVCSIMALYAGLWYFRDVNAFLELQHQRYDYNRIAVGLSLLLWPLFLVATRNFFSTIVCLLLFAGSCMGIFTSESETAKLGLICGVAAGLMASLHSYLKKAIFVVIDSVLLAMPFLVSLIEKMQSVVLPEAFAQAGHAHHRLQIWKGAADLAFEKFWFGWGMKSDRILALSGAMGEHAERAGFSAKILGPHNLALELWMNIGVVGMLFIAGVLVSIGFKTHETKQHVFAFVGIQVTAIVMFLAGSGATVIQGWLLAILAIASAMCITLGASKRHT
jgi:O-antigen ligase